MFDLEKYTSHLSLSGMFNDFSRICPHPHALFLIHMEGSWSLKSHSHLQAVWPGMSCFTFLNHRLSITWGKIMYILQRSCKWLDVYKTPWKMPGICMEITFVVAVIKRLMMKIDDVLSNVEKPQLLICSRSPLKCVLLKTFALLLYFRICTGSSKAQ